MSGYTYFADYYDDLIQNVNYKKLADYVLTILKQENAPTGTILDLACGTGSLSIELAKNGVDIIGVDSSCEMLSLAKDKAINENLDILFICQKMQELNICEPVDNIICTLDSLNHLKNFSEIERTFEKVSAFLKKGGYFIFDVNILYKHEVVLGNNTFVYETDNIFCVWQNYFNKKNGKVKIVLDFFEENNGVYNRESEEFFENAYEIDKIKKALENVNLQVIHVYNDFTFGNPTNQSQRVSIVAKKN